MKIFKITIPDVNNIKTIILEAAIIKTIIPNTIKVITVKIASLTSVLFGLIHSTYKLATSVAAAIAKTFKFEHEYKSIDSVLGTLGKGISFENLYKLSISVSALLSKIGSFAHTVKLTCSLNNLLMKHIALNQISKITILDITSNIIKGFKILHNTILESNAICSLRKFISTNYIYNLQQSIKMTLYKFIQIPTNQIKISDVITAIITRKRKFSDISDKTFSDITNMQMYDFVYISE